MILVLLVHYWGSKNKKQIETHYLKGALYENLVILELLKMTFKFGIASKLLFLERPNRS